MKRPSRGGLRQGGGPPPPSRLPPSRLTAEGAMTGVSMTVCLALTCALCSRDLAIPRPRSFPPSLFFSPALFEATVALFIRRFSSSSSSPLSSAPAPPWRRSSRRSFSGGGGRRALRGNPEDSCRGGPGGRSLPRGLAGGGGPRSLPQDLGASPPAGGRGPPQRGESLEGGGGLVKNNCTG